MPWRGFSVPMTRRAMLEEAQFPGRPPISDMSKVRCQTKCNPCIPGGVLGVGLRTPSRKYLLLQNVQSLRRRSRPTQGCSTSEEAIFCYKIELEMKI
jgi:hypothetical protein